MPYSKSSARRDFEVELARQIAMIRSVGPTKIPNQDVRAYVLSSAVALCSVAMELYLETLVSTWITKVRAAGTLHNQFPKELRWFIVFQSILKGPAERFVALKDERTFLDTVTKAWGAPNWELLDDAKAIAATTQLSLVVARKRYPSPDNIKLVFRRLGIPNLFSQLNKTAKTDVEALLTSFNDVRNNFAHSGVLVGFSVRDIVKTVRNLDRIVNSIDRAFFKHVVATYGQACWPN
ncbi:MAG: HEPN domain-containing protein [Lacunisphaera sp.]